MTIQCPICQEFSVNSRMEIEDFLYGQGNSQVTLHAYVRVFICQSCAFRYTDVDAEKIRHAAVCRHLKVMNPEQLVENRTNLYLTQEQVADITCIGTASISRWENGSTIQNRANDNLLYLISFPENRTRLISRAQIWADEPITSSYESRISAVVVQFTARKFSNIPDIDKAKGSAQTFKLRTSCAC